MVAAPQRPCRRSPVLRGRETPAGSRLRDERPPSAEALGYANKAPAGAEELRSSTKGQARRLRAVPRGGRLAVVLETSCGNPSSGLAITRASCPADTAATTREPYSAPQGLCWCSRWLQPPARRLLRVTTTRHQPPGITDRRHPSATPGNDRPGSSRHPVSLRQDRQTQTDRFRCGNTRTGLHVTPATDSGGCPSPR